MLVTFEMGTRTHTPERDSDVTCHMGVTVRYAVCGVWCVVCGVWCVVCGVRCGV